MASATRSQAETLQTSTLDMEKTLTSIEGQTEAFDSERDAEAPTYMHGIKLHLLTLGLCLSIFLVNLEISIVSTSLVSITDSFQQFGRSSWIVTAYLMTYTAFMVVLAKTSDTIGRKTVLIACLTLFTVFSGVCGAAQSINQLIVFRAFQGLGASGVYSIVLVVLFEMVPKEAWPKYSVLVTALFAISLLAGPLTGGAISRNTTWRWVFLLNVPAGVIALVLLSFCMPNNFPYHGRTAVKKSSRLGAIDAVGAGLMLTGVVLMITGFEEASNFSPWISARFLVPVLLSSLVLVVFLFYERFITLHRGNATEPVFPWRFCSNRIIMGILTNAFLCGAVFTSCIIQIPLRFQSVNNESPWHAGVRLVPFGIAVPVGAGFVAVLCGKRRLPPIYILFFASVLQILGLLFMSRLSLDHILWNGQYGLQFMTGLGCGLSIGVITLITPFVIEKQDLATSTSAVVQIRMLGGALVLAMITAVMNNDLNDTLSAVVTTSQMNRIFRTTEEIVLLPEPLRTVVKHAFMQGFNMQLRILIGFAAAEIPATLLMWQKDPVRIA